MINEDELKEYKPPVFTGLSSFSAEVFNYKYAVADKNNRCLTLSNSLTEAEDDCTKYYYDEHNAVYRYPQIVTLTNEDRESIIEHGKIGK